MKTLVLIGPPGAGKTETMANTFTKLTGRKFWIVNDDGDGTGETIDAGVFQGIKGLELVAMTGGCIGCKDAEETESVIRKIVADGECDWLIIEPIGYAIGNEVPDMLHHMGIHASVICIIDVRNFQENLVDGFMPPQIKAASHIALTKYGSASLVDDPSLDVVTDFIGEHNSEAEIFLLQKGEGLPEQVLLHHAHCTHGHHHTSCSHDHAHNHDHSHHNEDESEHSQFKFHRKLRPEATYPQVQHITASIPGVYRGKGTVEGQDFSMVRNDWKLDRLPDNRAPFLTLYSRQPILPDDLTSITLSVEDVFAGKDIKQVLRISSVPLSETEAAIRARLGKFPSKAFNNRFGELVTHPEVLSILSNLVRREGVALELKAKVFVACVEYWLSAVTLLKLRNQEEEIWKYQLALGGALAYYGLHRKVFLNEKLLYDLVISRPAHMYFAGLQKVERFNSDLAKAKTQAKEACDIAKFGLMNEEMNKRFILAFMNQCALLVQDRHELVSSWHQAISEIESFEV